MDAIFDTAVFDGHNWKVGPQLLHNRGQHRSILLGAEIFHIGGRNISSTEMPIERLESNLVVTWYQQVATCKHS